MKKKILIVLLIFLFLLTSLIFISCDKSENKNLSKYELDLIYDDESHILSGKERVEYKNSSTTELSFVEFNLYPNAYREDAKNPIVSKNSLKKAYPNGVSFGNIEIKSVKNENENFPFEIMGEDENILKVDLKDKLSPNEYTFIEIEFAVQLANINHRLGYGENTINVNNFYPIACVYEDGKGFSEKLYNSNGDPFYSDCANYKVFISYPREYILVSSGQTINSKNTENITKKTIIGEKIRDFSIILSKKLKKVSQVEGGTTVNYYGYCGDENLNEKLKVSVDGLKTFNKLFGVYPYKELNIVKTNFVFGGMEYPNLVMIGDDLKTSADENYVIIHEIAHQWWYGIVGNDEYNHAWIDEGLTEYSTMLFYKYNTQYNESFEGLINSSLQSYKLFTKVYKNVNGSVNEKMDRPVNQFLTEPEYVQCTYTKGTLMFYSIMKKMGENKFLSTLKSIFNHYSYKNVSPNQLIDEFSNKGGREIRSYINDWLNGTKSIDELWQ